MTDKAETYSDQILEFTLPARSARGRVVRLDSVIDVVLSAHAYPAPITHLLGEALVLAALMGSLLKSEGAQMTMQAQTEEGAVRLLVCDYRAGELRGYVDFDEARLADLGANPTLFALFGKGYLAITFEPGTGQRYQGIVPLEGDSLAQACENYFVQSEQIPTLLRVGMQTNADGTIAAGMLLQHLPEGEVGRERLHVRLDHPDWEHIAVLGSTLSHDELTANGLSMEAIVWRLFHEESEIRVRPAVGLSRGCRCSTDHYEDVVSRFSDEDRAEMRNDQGKIIVDCEFCSKAFELSI
jgi:molecular chaperone Hsp33